MTFAGAVQVLADFAPQHLSALHESAQGGYGYNISWKKTNRTLLHMLKKSAMSVERELHGGIQSDNKERGPSCPGCEL